MRIAPLTAALSVHLLLQAALLVSVTATASFAHEGHPEPSTFSEEEQHAPTPLPDRVMLTWSGDPTTTIDVTWRTDLATEKTVIEFAEAKLMRGDLRSGSVPGSTTVEGTCGPFLSDLGSYQLHTGQLQQLKPGTMYGYRVGDGEQHWSEWFQFRTASTTPEPFTFVYFGDAQNSVRSMWSRVIRESNQHAPRSAFFLHAGDLVNRGNLDGEWGEWYGAGGWLNGMIPSVATPGNHEYRDGLSRHWRPQFSFPLNGPPGLEETVYWFDYQGARIISLNSNEEIELQTAWLKKVLDDPNRPKWTVCTFHHPIFSAAKTRDNPHLRQAWRETIEQGGVDLVLQGHDHAYARSGLGGPTNVSDGIRTESGGAVYVVSVSGPKMYNLQETWDVPRAASGVQLFQVIKVDQTKIRYEARLASGELYDAFTLSKDNEGKKTLIEEQPEVEEINEIKD